MKRDVFILSACIFLYAGLCIGCSSTENSKPASERVAPIDTLQSVVDTTSAEIVEEPVNEIRVEDPPVAATPRRSSSSTYSYSSHSDDSGGDYWDEQRKHSPNDNYLLGFDEDVDDVHDMELYMEDY